MAYGHYEKRFAPLKAYAEQAKRTIYNGSWGQKGGANYNYMAGGHMNAAGVHCVTFLLLAKECGVDVDEFWLHSLRCAIAARLLARSVGDCDPEILFVAGICTISVYSSSINRKRHWLLKSGVKLTNSISFAIRQRGKYWASTTPRLVRC